MCRYKTVGEYLDLFTEWGEVRGLYEESDYDSQLLKWMSEFGEGCDNINKGRFEAAKDDIGDYMVCLTHCCNFSGVQINLEGNQTEVDDIFNYLSESNFKIAWSHMIPRNVCQGGVEQIMVNIEGICNYLGTTLEECMDVAWNDIKDRKGKFVNNVFVKESDLQENEK